MLLAWVEHILHQQHLYQQGFSPGISIRLLCSSKMHLYVCMLKYEVYQPNIKQRLKIPKIIEKLYLFNSEDASYLYELS